MGKFYPPPDLVAVGTARAPLWIWGAGIGLRWVGRPGRSGGRVRGWSKHEGVRHPGRGREGRGTGAGGSPRRRLRLRLKRGEHRPPGRARSGERSEAGARQEGGGEGGAGQQREGRSMYPAGWFHGGRRSIRGIVGKEFGLETMIPRGLERGEGGKSPAGHLLAFPRIRAQKRRILSSVRGGRPGSNMSRD